jgi:hypothetical protein
VLIAGLGQRYNDETSVGIPALWQRFDPHIGHIPGVLARGLYLNPSRHNGSDLESVAARIGRADRQQAASRDLQCDVQSGSTRWS